MSVSLSNTVMNGSHSALVSTPARARSMTEPSTSASCAAACPMNTINNMSNKPGNLRSIFCLSLNINFQREGVVD